MTNPISTYIDHTLLAATATRAEIAALCEEATRYSFAAVCVNGVWVGEASRHLAGSTVAVCTVVGFPLGASATAAKGHEARIGIADGAREIDMVIDLGGIKTADFDRVRADIAHVAAVTHDGGAILKVIIEAGALTDDEKVCACTLSVDAGADFVKTSTGFGPGGATVEDIDLMRRTVGPQIGVKASGGIRTIEAARALIAAGATRLGTSRGVELVQAG